MLDSFSLIVGCIGFCIINIIGDGIVCIETFISRRCNYGMSAGELASFKKYVRNCYDISYLKFRSLDAKD